MSVSSVTFTTTIGEIAAQAFMELKAGLKQIYLSDLVDGTIYNKESSMVQVELIAAGVGRLDAELGKEIMKTGSYTIISYAKVRGDAEIQKVPSQITQQPLGYLAQPRRNCIAIFGDTTQRGIMLQLPNETYASVRSPQSDLVATIVQLLCYRELEGRFGFRNK